MADVLYNTHPEELHSMPLMSERVQGLANNIYREFEVMIVNYGDGVIKNLMPQVVAILENLNQAYRERQEHEVEVELLRDENNNLKGQFDKEKHLRKMMEQKYLEMEDVAEEEKKQQAQRVEALESNVRRLEIKQRNVQDQLARQDERKAELKSENAKLQSRYADLLKTHAEYVEKYKLQTMSPEKSSHQKRGTGSSLVPRFISDVNGDNDSTVGESPEEGGGLHSKPTSSEVDGHSAAREASLDVSRDVDSIYSYIATVDQPQSETEQQVQTPSEILRPDASQHSAVNAHSEIIHRIEGDSQSRADSMNSGEIEGGRDDNNDSNSEQVTTYKSSMVDEWSASHNTGFDQVPDYAESLPSRTDDFYDIREEDYLSSLRGTSRELRTNTSSIFVELSSLQDADALLGDVDDGADLTNMSAEIDKIIMENTELLETKNALNVVKDDLIARLDELSGEHELLREELNCSLIAQERYELRITELEDELKQCRVQLEEMRVNAESEIGSDGQYRFSRVDMTRVIMERNHFKEKLMELQEAVRYAEMMRASREHPDLVGVSAASKKKSSIWSFFSSLGGNDTATSNESSTKNLSPPPPQPPSPSSTQKKSKNSSSVI